MGQAPRTRVKLRAMARGSHRGVLRNIAALDDILLLTELYLGFSPLREIIGRFGSRSKHHSTGYNTELGGQMSVKCVASLWSSARFLGITLDGDLLSHREGS